MNIPGRAPLRILINCLVLSERSGVAGASRALLELLRGLARVGTPHAITLLASDDGARLIPPEVPFVRLIAPALVARGGPRLLYEHLGLPVLVIRSQTDVLHSPTYVAPIWVPCASVVTVHDMTWYTHGDLHRGVKRRYFTAVIPWSVRRSDITVADSESTRGEILRRVRVDDQRVVTVPLGVDRGLFHPPSSDEVVAVRRRYDLADPYLLTVAQIHPRKNHRVVVQAMARLPSGRLTYVIVGKPLWGLDELQTEIDALGLGARVRFLGAVPDGELPALYAGAEATIYPSFAEGFGLPVLEAMACGAACVVSGTSSLPEVGGDAVLYFAPDDPEELRRRISEIVDDSGLRAHLRQAGLKRVARFTWENTARQIIGIYERAYQRHTGPTSRHLARP